MALADPQGAGDRPTTIWLPSGANFVSRLPPQPRNRGTEEPGPFSGQRRLADAESGHIRPFPVTRGLTPSNRVGLPHTEEAAVSGYAALCLPSAEPDHL